MLPSLALVALAGLGLYGVLRLSHRTSARSPA